MEQINNQAGKTNLPLSPNQRGLWIITQQDKTSPAYNVEVMYHLNGEINIDIFRESIRLLFDRQEAMFSVFRQKEDTPYIEILPRIVNVELKDFSHFPVLSRRKEILSFAGKETRKYFDLENGPLYRLYIFKEENNSYFFHATIHHLIFDGFSRRIFIQELGRIYSDLIRGIDSPAGPVKSQSTDYSELIRDELSSEKEYELIGFWKEYFRDYEPELKFPYDYQRKAEPTGLGRRESFTISKEYTEKLRVLSREEDVTYFNTLLSALGILLQKYTGEDDICIGIPVSNRRGSVANKLLGFFVTTVGVRLKIDAVNTFRGQIKQGRTDAMSAFLHSELAFDKIVEAINPRRIAGVNPLFQISFSWENNLAIPVDFGGIPVKLTAVKEGVSPMDISFTMWENGDYIEGEVEYNLDIIKPQTAVRLKDHFLTLIGNLVENPDLPVSSVSILSDEDKKMISLVNSTQTNYPKDKTIARLFEDQVKLYPDKTAAVYKESFITYKQLNEKSNQLARTLRNCGAGKNIPVGLFTDKSLEMVIGIMGILKAGSGYVPIDPDYPEERINFIIRDSGCKIILTRDSLYDKVNVEGVTPLSLDSELHSQSDISNPEIINTAEDLAYIIYTSGTTGLPKGTLIPQKGVNRLVLNANYLDIRTDDRVLQSNAIIFDASVEEIFGALLNGASLYIIDKQTLLDINLLSDFLLNNDITIVDLTSALFTQIAELRTDLFRKVRTLLVGGDVVSATHVNKVRRDNPQLCVINSYETTENTCNSTFYVVDSDCENNIPIGKPISNSTAYIFDKYMNYSPVGVTGELYVGGDGLSSGYLNRDELNRKCFIQHPYIPRERLYKTGDLVRWLPDWNIEFQGRADNQLKIRGFRVELEEIESVISNIEGVIETVINAVKVEEGDFKLIAFLNVSEAFRMEPAEMSNYLKTKLPSYMVPSAYKFLHGFPKKVNGKIDRKALVYDIKDLEARELKVTKPLSPTENVIYCIWSSTLKTKDIVTTDNFFDIGGNSLLAISVFSKITKAFKIELGLRIFFDSPRIKDLADMIDIKMNKLLAKDSMTEVQNDKIKQIEGEI